MEVRLSSQRGLISPLRQISAFETERNRPLLPIILLVINPSTSTKTQEESQMAKKRYRKVTVDGKEYQYLVGKHTSMSGVLA